MASRVTIPEQAHPLVRFIFHEMRRQQVTYYEQSERSGLSRETLTAWRKRSKPDLESLEAALGVLGYGLMPMPLGGRRSPRRRDPNFALLMELLGRCGYTLSPLPRRPQACGPRQLPLFGAAEAAQSPPP